MKQTTLHCLMSLKIQRIIEDAKTKLWMELLASIGRTFQELQRIGRALRKDSVIIVTAEIQVPNLDTLNYMISGVLCQMDKLE